MLLRAKLKIPAKIMQIHKEDTLGFVLAKLPNKDSWKRYYVRYSNSQLLFCPSVKVSLNLDIMIIET